jgi:FtsH-binding integral membrane protein
MLARLGIRLVFSLVGIALGILLSVAVVGGFSATAHAILVSTLVFWAVHIVVNFIALRILIRQPSVATAGLLALASTVVALIVVNIVVSGLKIHGVTTYLAATLIIWIATALAGAVGRRRIRRRRRLERPA